MGKYGNAIAFFVLLGLILLLSLYSISNIAELYTHQPEKQHMKYIRLDYPTDIILPTSSYTPEGNVNNPLLFTVDIYLIYNEPLIEGTPVTVKGVGFLYPKGQQVIGPIKDYKKGTIFHNAAIGGFKEAISSDNTKYNIDGAFPIIFKNSSMPETLGPNPNPNVLEKLPVLQQIYWETQGDYSPYIYFPFVNDSFPVFLFNENKIHINGPETLWQENYSKINTWLSIVLVVFTIITTSKLLYELGCKVCSDFSILQRNTKKTEHCPSDDTLPESQSEQPHP
jgi:hypothetical protein